jgi:hypothetical protein
VTIDWVYLPIALFLLWLPRPALRLGGRVFRRRRRRGQATSFTPDPLQVREPGDKSVSFRTEFAKARNYIDLFRAALGSVALLGMPPGIEPALQAEANATHGAVLGVFYTNLALLVVAVLVQSFRLGGRVTMVAPIFFMAGLSIGLCGPYAAAFAFVLIWTINLTLPNPTGFLSVYALLILVFGLLFAGISSPLPLCAAILVFLPVLLSLLIRRPLVQFARKVKTGGSATAT